MAYEEILTVTNGVSTNANQGLDNTKKANARANIGALGTDNTTEGTLVNIDSTPTSGSTNLVTSGGVYDAISDFVDTGDICNPNLIDNAWFAVNQRESSSYSVSGRYGHDRWKINGNGLTVTPRTNVGYSNSASFAWTAGAYYEQKIIDCGRLQGKTVTISGTFDSVSSPVNIMIRMRVNGNWTGYSVNVTTNGLVSKTITLPASLTALSFEIGGDGGSCICYGVKLELGSISTLEFDTIPDYSEELARCQPYCFAITGGYAGSGLEASDTRANILVPLPRTMYGTITLDSNASVIGTVVINDAAHQGNAGIAVTAWSYNNRSSNSIFMMADVASGLTAGNPCFLCLRSASKLVFHTDKE